MSAAFWQARLASTELQIVAYEAAILALTTGGIESYDLDTGQTRQKVTKLNLKAMQSTLGSLMNRYATLNARLYGTGVLTARSTP